MATRVQWCLLWSSEDGMFEGAYSKHRRRRLGSIYEYAGVLIYRVCQSIENATNFDVSLHVFVYLCLQAVSRRLTSVTS